jgi:hypothetical protein
MLKRISLANALAIFVAASGTFFFIAGTTPSDVHNLVAPVARVSAAPLNAAEPDKVFNDNIKELARNNASIDDAGKAAIDLGEFIIHAR